MSLALNSPINELTGIGPKLTTKMGKLGINTVGDALTYFPLRYNNFQLQNPAMAVDKQKLSLKGTVVTNPKFRSLGYHRAQLSFLFLVNGNKIWIDFFHGAWYLQKKIHKGDVIIVWGRWSAKYHNMSGQKVLTGKQATSMQSVYHSTKGVKQADIRKVIKTAYKYAHGLIRDYVPEKIRARYHLEHEQKMIHDMHFPANGRAKLLAQRTAKFNDFFLYQMRLQAMRVKKTASKGVQIHYNLKKVVKFVKSLPFELTGAQKRVVNEISADLLRPTEMNRLLQGDVGSGKTIVAAIAIYEAVTAGYQTAIMVPTSVLAKQHASNLGKTFKNVGVNIGLLTGDIKPKDKEELLKHIANGDINLVIGTDALIQDTVKYHNLGLAVIDEQHRFGVDQRQALRMKGNRPNMLAMTATPIPRTLEITAYGDMDVSVIDQLPKGRKPVITKWYRTSDIPSILPKLENIMSNGQQIYAVVPLVKQNNRTKQQQEDDQKKQMFDAERVYEAFKYHFSPKFKIGLLHGQMDDDKKDAIMSKFKKNEYQLLVATTVIEVGVDVSNATVMMIFNADHFGLSQLHQLRGRVGRGSQQAYCYLVADPKTKDGIKRMRVMESTTNGFVVSREDLKLRGGGDIFGQSQSGIPKFKVGDPIADRVILNYAQQEARNVVCEKNWSRQPANWGLVQKLTDTGHSDILD